MTRPRLLAFVFALAASAAAAQKPGIAPDPLAAIVATRLDAVDAPTCLVLAVIEDAARVTFACSRGAGPVDLTRESIFEIGSITKGLTGILLADMVLKGEVALDDAASKHARAGAKLPGRDGHEITLRDLATQTSGLPRLPPGFAPKNSADPYADFGIDALYDALARTELRAAPGTAYEYSNFGFMWLSELLSRRAGKPYDVLLAERVLRPLGMADAAVRVSEEQRKRSVAGHDATYKLVSEWNFVPELAGVGGVRASMDDMIKLAEALAGKRETSLGEAIKLATTPLRPSGGRNSTGLGWVTHERPDARVLWHNGGTGGFRSMVAVNTASGKAAVVLVDSAQSFDDLALHLVDPGAPPMKQKRVALPTGGETRKQYVGAYELRPGFVITVFEEGDRLMSQASGQGAVEIFREAPDRFFLRVVEAQLTFNRGADGNVESLTLHQGGRQVPGRRLK